MDIIKEASLRGVKSAIVRGDLTESDTDAIVNAANSYLQHGGGVAAAIARKGGPTIQKESNVIGFVPVGHCAVTTGGLLRSPYVIHAVGPRFGEGDEENKLRQTIRSVFAMAQSRGFRSISIPAISAGIFGFPRDRCAAILVEETFALAEAGAGTLADINYCLMDEDMINPFVHEIDRQERGT